MFLSKLSKLAIHPLAIILFFISVLVSYKFFGMEEYFSFNFVRQSYFFIMSGIEDNLYLVILLYMIFYIFVTTLSIPVATYLTIIGGLAFGPYKGTLIVLVSATIGATFIFIMFRYASNYFSKKINNKYLENIKEGFNRNPFNYLLLLRLLPIFPFFLVNIISAVMNISSKKYIAATFIGMIPMTFFYCSLGSNAGLFIDKNEFFNFDFLISINFIIPFAGIILLLFLSYLYKQKIRGHND